MLEYIIPSFGNPIAQTKILIKVYGQPYLYHAAIVFILENFSKVLLPIHKSILIKFT